MCRWMRTPSQDDIYDLWDSELDEKCFRGALLRSMVQDRIPYYSMVWYGTYKGIFSWMRWDRSPWKYPFT